MVFQKLHQEFLKYHSCFCMLMLAHLGDILVSEICGYKGSGDNIRDRVSGLLLGRPECDRCPPTSDTDQWSCSSFWKTGEWLQIIWIQYSAYNMLHISCALKLPASSVIFKIEKSLASHRRTDPERKLYSVLMLKNTVLSLNMERLQLAQMPVSLIIYV